MTIAKYQKKSTIYISAEDVERSSDIFSRHLQTVLKLPG